MEEVYQYLPARKDVAAQLAQDRDDILVADFPRLFYIVCAERRAIGQILVGSSRAGFGQADVARTVFTQLGQPAIGLQHGFTPEHCASWTECTQLYHFLQQAASPRRNALIDSESSVPVVPKGR